MTVSFDRICIGIFAKLRVIERVAYNFKTLGSGHIAEKS